MRLYAACNFEQLRRLYRIIAISSEGGPGHGLVHLLLKNTAEFGFMWDSDVPGWSRLGLLCWSDVDQCSIFGVLLCGWLER